MRKRVTAHGATDAASRDDLIVDLADRRIARAADFPHQRTGRSAREGHRPLHTPSPRLHRPGPATRYLFLSHPSAASLGELSRIRLRHDHRARRPAELFSDTDSGAWRHARCLWQAVDRFRSRAQFGPQRGGTRKAGRCRCGWIGRASSNVSATRWNDPSASRSCSSSAWTCAVQPGCRGGTR